MNLIISSIHPLVRTAVLVLNPPAAHALAPVDVHVRFATGVWIGLLVGDLGLRRDAAGEGQELVAHAVEGRAELVDELDRGGVALAELFGVALERLDGVVLWWGVRGINE